MLTLLLVSKWGFFRSFMLLPLFTPECILILSSILTLNLGHPTVPTHTQITNSVFVYGVQSLMGIPLPVLPQY